MNNENNNENKFLNPNNTNQNANNVNQNTNIGNVFNWEPQDNNANTVSNNSNIETNNVNNASQESLVNSIVNGSNQNSEVNNSNINVLNNEVTNNQIANSANNTNQDVNSNIETFSMNSEPNTPLNNANTDLEQTNIGPATIDVKPVVNNTQNVSTSTTETLNTSNNTDESVSSENLNLIKAFMGKNYDKILNGKLNIPTIIVGNFYLYYRKMLGYGFLAFIIEAIVLTLVGYLTSSNEVLSFVVEIIACIVINVLIMLMSNKLYLKFTKDKINKLIKKHPGTTYPQLEPICSKAGGTSIGIIFGGFFLEVLIVVLMMVVLAILFMGALSSMVTGIANKNKVQQYDLQEYCSAGPNFSTSASFNGTTTEIVCGSADANGNFVCTRTQNGQVEGSTTCQGES